MKLVLTLPSNSPICDGKQVTFKAPCNSKSIDALSIGGVEYAIVNASGESVCGCSEAAWVEGAIVSVILDTRSNKAYIQNPNVLYAHNVVLGESLSDIYECDNLEEALNTRYETTLSTGFPTHPSGFTPSGLAYGDGKYVFITENSDSIAFYSIDGIRWSKVFLPTENWSCITYGSGKFVAISKDTHPDDSTKCSVAYSEDGKDWTLVDPQVAPPYCVYRAICHTGSEFLAISREGDTSAFSTDGILWEERELPGNKYWTSVCSSKSARLNEQALAVGFEGSGALLYGPDKKWVPYNNIYIENPGSRDWKSICYGGDRYVVISSNSVAIGIYDEQKSLIQWTGYNLSDATYFLGVPINGLVYDDKNGLFVAVGTHSIYYSTNGIHWNSQPLGSTSMNYTTVTAGDKVVAISSTLSQSLAIEFYKSPRGIARISDIDEAVSGLVRMKTGYYTGTGEHGSDNPNILEFDFTPSLLIVYEDNGDPTNPPLKNSNYNVTMVRGKLSNTYVINDTAGLVNIDWLDRSVSWYNSIDPTLQLNSPTSRYTYIAFGI